MYPFVCNYSFTLPYSKFEPLVSLQDHYYIAHRLIVYLLHQFKAQRMYLQGKGGGTGLSPWNMRRLGICGAAPPKPDI